MEAVRILRHLFSVVYVLYVYMPFSLRKVYEYKKYKLKGIALTAVQASFGKLQYKEQNKSLWSLSNEYLYWLYAYCKESIFGR